MHLPFDSQVPVNTLKFAKIRANVFANTAPTPFRPNGRIVPQILPSQTRSTSAQGLTTTCAVCTSRPSVVRGAFLYIRAQAEHGTAARTPITPTAKRCGQFLKDSNDRDVGMDQMMEAQKNGALSASACIANPTANSNDESAFRPNACQAISDKMTGYLLVPRFWRRP
jgi:hypothetical protein